LPDESVALPADRLNASTIPARIVASWNTVSTRWNPVALIVGAWAVLTLPLVFFRGYNSDEGLAVVIARTALEDGYWLSPHTFNVRFVERPTLLSWIIAAISEPFGQVSQIAARLPVALFLLLGCLLIYALLRKVAASVAAALLGVALFLACPLVMRSYVMITADMPLAVLLFLAFVLWWDGYARGSIGYGRWIAIGLVLALAGLMKGPQPVSYFALGIGLFVLGSRSWRQIPGLIVAGIVCVIPLAAWYGAVYAQGDEAQWAAFMRLRPVALLPGPIVASFNLVTETLPAMLCAVLFVVGRRFRGVNSAHPGFLPAIACYAFTASLIILFWPGGSTPRYFFPMVLPLCVLGGVGYDSLNARRPEIVAPVLLLTAGLLIYALGYSVASPFLPARFRHTQMEATRLTELVQAQPAPIYTIGATALNVLPYVPGRILFVTPGELETVAAPAWVVLPPADADALLSRPRSNLREVTPSGVQAWRVLRLDR
jgi:4-amino-4-deoxy-L-arabinose transferase-like glycosyltransferase